MHQSKRVLYILIILVIFSLSIGAEEVVEPRESQSVYINAESLSYQEEKTILSGGVRIRKADTLITALTGDLFRSEQRIFLEDDIRAEYPDGIVTASFLNAFLNEEEYIFEETVLLNYRLSAEKDILVLTSQYLKLFGSDNSFTAEKDVEIDYEGQNFRGDRADYDGQTEILLLSGNVEIEEDGDWIKSDRASFNLAEGEEGYTAEGNVELMIRID
ncbi:LptA/OstA family protein [Halanaerobium hydrogeniformans]|uniref:OstA family protein n=1 Tax=Halanaerobium hydrogeniformans TaxID=656519 RepID=E4RPQ3_HALHG|nr:LptA/OstA family protein [Halanaerobium hydrogeniformans]ADQ13937.1 OstA family protein [Halanaerobium hydrogeniformans]